ncbi:TPA: hypothetical protein ACVGJS_004725 [Pseudomonas aeruginosa]
MPSLRPKPYLLVTLPSELADRVLALNSIDTTVPLRHEQRNHDHTEIHCILGALKCGRDLPLAFPAEIIHSDRPDIVIKTPLETIGVEIVEAASPTAASLEVLRARTPEAPSIAWARKEIPGSPQLPARQLKQVLAEEVRLEQDESLHHLRGGDGFAGDGAVAWAKAMAHFVGQKMEGILKAGFSTYDRNWLLVYDNWGEQPISQAQADDQLQLELQLVGAFTVYDLVLILNDEALACFSPAGHWRNRKSR